MKHFPTLSTLKNRFTWSFLLAFVFFCQLSGQQITLANLKQRINALISYDADTKKYGLQTLDKKTQLLPNEYDQIADEGYHYFRFIKVTKNGQKGIYDGLSQKLVIEPIYSKIDMKEFPVAGPVHSYFKDNHFYFLTMKDLGKGKRTMGLHDGQTEVLPCEYENIWLINYKPTDSVLIFAARKSQGPLQLYDYTHRRFLEQTFSHIEAETTAKGPTRYKVTSNGKVGIVDAELKWVIDPNYLEIMIYDQYNHTKYREDQEFIYVLRITDSTCTFTNYKNPKITKEQPSYTQIRNYDKYVNVYKGKKLGLVTLDHEQILPCQYVDLSPLDSDSKLWIAYADKGYGIVNLKNEKLCAMTYTAIEPIKPPYALLYKNESYTILNTKTRKIDSRVFKPSGYINYDPSEYILSATFNNKVVLLDSNLVIKKTLTDPPMMEAMADESSDIRSVEYATEQSADFMVPPEPSMDESGKSSRTQSKYKIIKANNLQGLMDTELDKEVMKPVYKRIILKEVSSKKDMFKFAGYQKDKEFGVVDLKTGSTVFSDEMNALYMKQHDNNRDLTYFELEYKINTTLKKALADTSGILTQPLYDQISPLDSRNFLALVYTENNSRYIDVYDLKNKKYILKKVQHIQNLSINHKFHYFDVTKEDVHGIVNEEGQTLLPFKYKNLSFDRATRLGKSSDKFGILTTTKDKYVAMLIDKSGKLNLTSAYDTIYPGVYDYVIAKSNNNYGLVNIRTGKKPLALNKQSVKIVVPNRNKRDYFVYVIDKGKHCIYDSAFQCLTENTDTMMYAGTDLFYHRQKTGFKLYTPTTKKFGFYTYTGLSLINDKELFAIRNDSVLTIDHDEKILKVWDTKHSSHELRADVYPSKERLMADFMQCLSSPDTKALMTWCQKSAQDLTLYNYFESKNLNEKITQKTGSVFKSPDTQKNAEALFAIYSKLYEALHEAHGKEFSIEYLSAGFIDDKSINYFKNRTNDAEVAYNKPVIFFKIQNTVYQYEMGYLFNELNKLFVYPNEGARTQ